MKRRGHGLRMLLLPLVLCALPGCGGGLPSPVLLLKISSVPEMTIRLRVEATLPGGGKKGAADFYRGPENKFLPVRGGMAPMLPVPTSVDLAVDLPAGTSG